ncbi:unnamed protein product [Effrenium voratum]|uniref:LCCL domain-containing protein n=1 Tax=Effrenium voratum TaxID=2562239 RepID=A0AA36N3K9_9DINO|nr:unnamed protein product [Effrenium voratum]
MGATGARLLQGAHEEVLWSPRTGAPGAAGSFFVKEDEAPMSHDLQEPKAVQMLSCQSTGHDVRWQGNLARVACPAHCQREPSAVAVGTGVHPLGSPICLGAIVDRVLPVYGGEMILTKAAPVQAQRMLGKPAGLESYSGGESNVAVSVSATGLKGEAWHAYTTDSLDMSRALPPEHVVEDCMEPFQKLPLQTFGDAMVINCPARCTGSGKLAGTLIYSPDSSMCWAAEHGQVVGPHGGRAVVTRRHGQNEFFGSTNQGSESQDAPGANASYTVALPTSDVLARMAVAPPKPAFF